MLAEIEAKFLDIDHDAMRAKLRELGAVCSQPMRLMRRSNYDFPDRRLDKINAWVRLRNEGDKVTLSYKQLDNRKLDGTKEASVTVDDSVQADQFLHAVGLVPKSAQESKRESWMLGDVQIELDEWPWIKPMLEIEGPDEAQVKHAAEQLGLDWTKAVHGSVEIAYLAEYDVTEQEVDDWPEILFGATPDWLAAKRKPQRL